MHANIQKDGTYSVVPLMYGGVTSPAELKRIAEVAEKYDVKQRVVEDAGNRKALYERLLFALQDEKGPRAERAKGLRSAEFVPITIA